MTLLNTLEYVAGKAVPLSDLIAAHMLTQGEADFLVERLQAGESLVIGGLPGAGKNTLLRALVHELDREVAVVPCPTRNGYDHEDVKQFMYEALASKAEVIVLEEVMHHELEFVIHEAVTNRQFISTGTGSMRGAVPSLKNVPTIIITNRQVSPARNSRIEQFLNF